jgi:hypothetical protein
LQPKQTNSPRSAAKVVTSGDGNAGINEQQLVMMLRVEEVVSVLLPACS